MNYHAEHPAQISRAQALTSPSTIYHRFKRNADGSAMRVRSSGKCQTWVTRPEEFKLPVKYGLYESGYITHANAHEWTLYEPAPVKKPVKQPELKPQRDLGYSWWYQKPKARR